LKAENPSASARIIIGELVEREIIPQGAKDNPKYRIKIKQANRDVYGADYIWVDEDSIVDREATRDIVIFERLEWGDFYGFIKEVRDGGGVQSSEAGWIALQAKLPLIARIYENIKQVEKKDIGGVNYQMEKIRLKLKQLALRGESTGPNVEALQNKTKDLDEKYRLLTATLAKLREGIAGSVIVAAQDGREKEIPIFQIVRAYRPNAFGVWDKVGFFIVKFYEFVMEDPRESNTEGGVFPAIFGTVLMVIIMSLFTTPLGVLAAFYLREYARQGVLVSVLRIAVNNLAGVPSIVFGVFGVGFFIYIVGGSIDRVFFPEALPTPTYGTGGILWASLTLALLTVPVVIVATEEGLAAVPPSMREASLALGATKFETIWRVVLPAVMPSILTGLILAMARAAGEVAPLMITGVVKLAPSLPLDTNWPFLHLDRKFMHLGFHIYDVGFQSPNVDAARHMVYTTTMLLILIVLLLNLAAILLRNRMRKKLAVSGL
jgi:phosphate transport system permease protein